MPAQVGKYDWCYASGEDDSEEIKVVFSQKEQIPVAELLFVELLRANWYVGQVFVPIEDSIKAKDCDAACREHGFCILQTKGLPTIRGRDGGVGGVASASVVTLCCCRGCSLAKSNIRQCTQSVVEYARRTYHISESMFVSSCFQCNLAA